MLDQTTTFDAIELFGLTENGTDDLIIPNDDQLRDQIVFETFETLIGGLQGTGLASEIEPLAHGMATLLQRRAWQGCGTHCGHMGPQQQGSPDPLSAKLAGPQ